MAFSCSTSIPPTLPSSRFRSLRTLLLPRRSLSALRPPPPQLAAVPYLDSAAIHAPFSVRAMAADRSSGFDPRAGVPVYKPRSYDVLVSDAAKSLVYALDDGKTRLEIDFPPLPSSISSYKGSSDEFIDANIQLALAVVRKVQELRGIKACIVFSDQPEKRRASQLFKTALDMISDLSIGSLDDVPVGPVTSFFKSIRNTLDFDFSVENEGLF